MERDIQIFISYASDDFERVLPYYEYLDQQGFSVWMDQKKLVAGQKWDLEIRRAFSRSTIVIAFISKKSYDKRGYIQRELKLALTKLEEKLPDDIYIIPVRLDADVERPEELSSIQFIDSDTHDSKEQIMRAITLQLTKLGAKEERLVEEQDIRFSINKVNEEWEGCPGYEFSGERISLFSRTHKYIENISEIINADLTKQLTHLREIKFDQDPAFYHFGKPKYSRMNYYDRIFSSLDSNGRILSIRFTDYFYSAGAAHHNLATQCYNFTLSPITALPLLADLFKDPDQAFSIIQEEARNQLRRELNPDDEDNEYGNEWIDNGTASWDDFSTFYFTKEYLQIDFSPYHVAAFAYGVRTVSINNELLRDYLKPIYEDMLIVGWI
ncbi:TIR domain-containing protein [Yersinia enterocolitica]